MLIDPAASPVGSAVPVTKLERPDIVELGHGLVMLMGGEMAIIGLMPPLLNSVAPSGIVPPLRVASALDPGVESGDALPVDIGVDDVQPEAAAPIAYPPPSNVPLVPVDEPLLVEITGALDGHGLRPPGSISVAPSGIPVMVGELAPSGRVGFEAVPEPGMPSGDVAPIPDVIVVLCACAMSQLNAIAISTSRRRGMRTS